MGHPVSKCNIKFRSAFQNSKRFYYEPVKYVNKLGIVMHIFIGSHCLLFLSIGKGSQMRTSCGHNLSALGRDDDTVGVDEKVVLEDVGDRHGG